MLELVWPGKEKSAALCSTPVERSWDTWVSASFDSSNQANFESANHRVIAADNLDALKLLRDSGQRYDVIYIDPPYNTGSALTYNDKNPSGGAASSATWLNSIYPRMILARDVLASRYDKMAPQKEAEFSRQTHEFYA